ncbi:amino acid adenylation domain-containing protein [Sorangium sp. So ce448]|uniref:amino acid adenylation domain-containing protein n=1 Tax=Sorangium sp. So ce448 TaxID=3133314 RepID=UPI003F628E45
MITGSSRPLAARAAGGTGLLHALVEESARRHADKLALADRRKAYSYRELMARASGLARTLRARGVRPGSFVAVCCTPSPEMVIAQLAVLLAGGAYLPLDPRCPQQRLSFMLEDSGAEILLADRGGIEADVVLRIDRPDGEGSGVVEEAAPKARDPWRPPAAEDLAYLIYTSGSTGEPKGVMIEHRAIVNFVLWDIETFGLGPHDRVSQVFAPSFDGSVWEIWPALVSGASVHFADRADYGRPGALYRWLAEEAITCCSLPTPLAETLLREPAPPRLSLKKMLVGGDRLRAYAPRGVPFELHNLYGPTEATIAASWGRVAEAPDGDQRPPHVGKPIANVHIRLLDEALQPVPPGAVGELYIGGAGVARGYHNRPELTRSRFIRDPFDTGSARDGRPPGTPKEGRLYRTGDLARLRPDGNIDFLGRVDHQVKLRGHRIELGDIEVNLAAHPGLKTAFAMLHASSAGERIVAYAVPVSSEGAPAAEDILAFAAERLPAYMMPSQLILLRELPLTLNGKVDRGRLPSPDVGRTGVAADGASFAGSMALLWARALGVESVGEEDSFFALGGHSIAALSVLAEVDRAFAVRASLSDLIEAPTLASFCRRLEERYLQTNALGVRSLPRALARPAEAHEPFQLTGVQHAYWLGRHEIFELGGVATHIYVELEGTFDVARLEEAWRRVVEHHPMLRAVIRSDGRQQVLENVPAYEIATYDLGGASAAEAGAHVERLRDELSHQVLPAERWPLFDIRATRLPGGAQRLHLSFDALILDAQSLFRVVEEWRRLYEDPGRLLLPSATSFRDYVMALEALKRTEAYAASAAYWRERAPSLPPGPELPLAKDPWTLQRPRFRRRRFELDPDAFRSFRQKAHAAGLTEAAVLLSVYAEVLSTWSKSPHFCLNLTLFNRLPLCDDSDQLVGDFTSITLLEVDHRAGESFLERARALQQRLWADLDHRLYSGVEVLRDRMAQGRRKVAAPVVFTSELGFEALGRDAGAIERFGREVDAITQTPQVWIDLQVVDRGGSLIACWDAVEELFPPGVLDAMFEAFRGAVGQLARSDDAWRQRAWVPGAPPAALPEVVGPRGPDALLHDGFVAWAARAPERVAVVTGERVLRYGELLGLARGVAAAILGERGDGEFVGVVLPKGWEQVVAALGASIAGRAYVPLDASLPAERRLALMRQAGIRTVLTLPRLSRELSWPAGTRCIAIDGRELSRQAGDLPPRRSSSSPAYVIYTSGSTGVPKGVVIEHRSAVNTVEDINDRFGVGPNDRVFGISSLGFDLSVYDIFGPLGRGGAVVLPDEEKLKDPGHFRHCLSEHGVTIWNSVPSLAGLLVETAGDASAARALGSLRLILMSGDWIPVDLPARIRRLNPRVQIVSLGGATEASIWSIHHVIGEVDPSWRSIPYGRALARQSVEVLDAQLRRRPTWAIGELFIGGVGVAQGYLNDPERTAASFIVHPVTGERLYRTGDLGRTLPSGEIEFLGRQDQQVKINGYRVELGEIEAVLQRCPGVRACAVAAPEAARGRRLVAGVALADEAAGTGDLRAHLARHLPEYMVPSSLRVVSELPLTPNGKVDRAALARLCDASDAALPAAQPEGEIEAAIRSIWGEVLRRPEASIDVTRNFFDIGGDSVSAIHVLARIKERFGVELPVIAVFEHPTVRAIADVLRKAESPCGGEGIGVMEAGPPGNGALPAQVLPEERAERRRAAAVRLRRRGT